MNKTLNFLKKEWKMIFSLMFMVIFVCTLDYLVEAIQSNGGLAANISSLIGFIILQFIMDDKKDAEPKEEKQALKRIINGLRILKLYNSKGELVTNKIIKQILKEEKKR